MNNQTYLAFVYNYFRGKYDESWESLFSVYHCVMLSKKFIIAGDNVRHIVFLLHIILYKEKNFILCTCLKKRG